MSSRRMPRPRRERRRAALVAVTKSYSRYPRKVKLSSFSHRRKPRLADLVGRQRVRPCLELAGCGAWARTWPASPRPRSGHRHACWMSLSDRLEQFRAPSPGPPRHHEGLGDGVGRSGLVVSVVTTAGRSRRARGPRDGSRDERSDLPVQLGRDGVDEERHVVVDDLDHGMADLPAMLVRLGMVDPDADGPGLALSRRTARWTVPRCRAGRRAQDDDVVGSHVHVSSADRIERAVSARSLFKRSSNALTICSVELTFELPKTLRASLPPVMRSASAAHPASHRPHCSSRTWSRGGELRDASPSPSLACRDAAAPPRVPAARPRPEGRTAAADGAGR